MVECNCECAHHLERVLLEVISSQQVVSEHFYPRLVRMSDDAHAPTPTLHPPRSETHMSTSILMLTSTNYRLWAMRMEVSLEAHDLWGVIDGSEVNRKKDRLALSMILNSISESQSNQIDIKKSAKENWEVLRTFHVGMDKVVQEKVQALKREFETISMKRNEKIDDYSNRFARIVTNLRDLGKVLMSMALFQGLSSQSLKILIL